jgi:ATP-dependent Clp protease protease subunit
LRCADEDNDEKDDEKKAPEPQSSEITKALFKSRTVLVFGEVDMKMAERVTAQLLAYAESEGDIRVVVNSPGGHVESGDTIHDMIRFVGNRVKMIGTGWVASAGAHIFLGAKKENRFCLPFTRFLLHQPLGGVRGQASDISIEAEEILKLRARLI